MSETPRPMFLFTSTGVPVQVKEWFSNSGDSVNSVQSRQSNPAQEEKSKWLNLTKGQESQIMKLIRSGTQLQKDLKEALDVLQNIVKETNPEYRGHQAPEASSPKITSTLSRSVTHLSGPGSRYTSPLSTLSSNSSTNDASKGPRKSLSTNSKPETASSSTTVSTGSMELPRSELRPRNPNAMTQSLSSGTRTVLSLPSSSSSASMKTVHKFRKRPANKELLVEAGPGFKRMKTGVMASKSSDQQRISDVPSQDLG